MKKEDHSWLANRFGIPESEILWYNAGICYSRIGVKSMDSANKVHEAVKTDYVNGGMLHGMPLGGISECTDEKGNLYYDVTC